MIFRIAPNGSLSSFASLNGKNGCPFEGGPLVKGLDGNLYGTTFAGGSNVFCRGTIFRLATNGILTTLASFNGTNGWQPEAGLVLGTDGDFYGTTAYGGAGYKQGMITPELAAGTVFRLTPNGLLTTLASFQGTDGAYPFSGLVQGTDGILYGTTLYGGIGYNGSINTGYGAVFGITPAGVFTTLALFEGVNGAHP